VGKIAASGDPEYPSQGIFGIIPNSLASDQTLLVIFARLFTTARLPEGKI
jgi:hypothetical protein